jgi:periplasmic protein TonB
VSAGVLPAPGSSRGVRQIALFVGISLAVHTALLLWLSAMPAAVPPQRRVTELVVVEVDRPAPPQAKPEPKPPEPRPVRRLFEPKLYPRKLFQPSPNDTPPPEAKPTDPPPVVVGLTMRSTTTAGTFDAPVGNTLAAKTPDKAADPANVRPSPVPLYELDSQPTVIGEVRIPYPEDARSRGIEGTVVLSVLVDETGHVRGVKIISGPGGGLDQAAAKAVERVRFRPALRKGQPVAAQITYRYTFLLD